MDLQNNTDKILESLENCSKAKPSEEFLLKMENLALRYTSVVEKVSLRSIISIAATFLLLLMVNMMILNKSTANNTEKNTSDIASASYDLIPTKSLYNE